MDMVVGDSGIFKKFVWGSRRDRDRDLTPLALNFRCLLIVKLKYSKIYAYEYQHMVKEHDCQVITAIKWSQICQSTVCPIYVSTHALDFHACIHILKLCIIIFASNTCQLIFFFVLVFLCLFFFCKVVSRVFTDMSVNVYFSILLIKNCLMALNSNKQYVFLRLICYDWICILKGTVCVFQVKQYWKGIGINRF